MNPLSSPRSKFSFSPANSDFKTLVLFNAAGQPSQLRDELPLWIAFFDIALGFLFEPVLRASV
jgi:hypothetical protein